MGRSHDNDVILHSSVVSRHHIELWPNESNWEIISLGSNGTYVDNQLITQEPLVDGMVIRLGNTGPKLQINLVESDDSGDEPPLPTKQATPSSTPGAANDRQTFLTNPNLKRTRGDEPPPTDVDI